MCVVIVSVFHYNIIISCAFQFKLDDLLLSGRAREKMIDIAGPRYNHETGNIQLVGKRYNVGTDVHSKWTVDKMKCPLQMSNKEAEL